MADIFTFEVDDTSPSISYSPFADTLSVPNILAGWNPYFDGSGFAAAPGEIGFGTSMHITALNGASVSLQWQGTAIQIFGNATQASFSVTLDGVISQPDPTSLQDNILASFSGLDDTNHTISLTAQTSSNSANSFIAFDKFTVSSPSLANSARQSLPESSVAFNGRWSFQNGSSTNAPSHISTTNGDRVSTQFVGSALFLHGATSPSSGSFRVVLDGTATTLSAKSSFFEPNSLLFFATGLDTNRTHTVQVFNEGAANFSIPTDAFVVASTGNPVPPEPTPSPSPSPSPVSVAAAATSFPRGTVAALVLAGILAFILFSLLLLFFCVILPRRRRRKAHVRQDPPSKELEAAEVLDIGPDGPSGDFSAGRIGFVGESRGSGGSGDWWRERTRRESNGSRRASGRSTKTGFARWKEEVENGFGGRGLMGIGLAFRHSLSVGGGGTIRDHDNNDHDESDDEKVDAADRRDKSKNEPEHRNSVSSSSSSGPSHAIREKKRAKGKRVKPKIKRKDSSPSFAIDLPLPTLPHNNGHSSQPPSRVHSRTNSGSAQSALLSVPRSHSGSSGTRASQQRQEARVPTHPESSPALSYISAPSDQPSPIQTKPPAPTVEQSSDSLEESQPGGSTLPRRSLPVRPLPVPQLPTSSASQPHHARTDSKHFLLQDNDPNPGSPDDDPYEPVHVAAVAFTTPDTIDEVDEQVASRGLLQPPSMPRADRGSISSGYMTDMDGLVLAETTTGQVAVRGLSPRTAHRQNSDALPPPLRVNTGVAKPLPQPAVPQTSLPQVQTTSPLSLDFWSSSPEAEEPTTRMSVRFQTTDRSRMEQGTSPASASTSNSKAIRALPRPPTLQLKSTFRLTPLAMSGVPSPERTDSDGPTSFLDFAGSSDVSVFTHDSSSHRISQSRWSGPSMITSLHKKPSLSRADTAPLPGPSSTAHEKGNSQSSRESRQRSQSHSQSESSGQGSNSSGHFPFPVSIPPSPHHPPGSNVQFTRPLDEADARPRALNLPSIPYLNIIGSSPHSSTQVAHPRHPSMLGGPSQSEAISPTDSVPMSVSDIHFRHTDSESGGDATSRRESSTSHLPPHPPLPLPIPGVEEPLDPASAASAEYLVQRVLGRGGTPPFSGGLFGMFPGSQRTELYQTEPKPGPSSSRRPSPETHSRQSPHP